MAAGDGEVELRARQYPTLVSGLGPKPGRGGGEEASGAAGLVAGAAAGGYLTPPQSRPTLGAKTL